MKQIKSENEKLRDKNIRKIKKATKELRNQGYKIENCLTETIIGTKANHIYIRDKLSSGRICEQKYLFSLDN